MSYGVLKTYTNTGLDSELLCKFAAPLSIVSNSPTYASDTMSLKRVRSRQPAQRWEIEAAIAQSDDLRDLFVNMVVAGASDTIYIRMPQLWAHTKVNPNLVLKVGASAAAGSTNVTITGAGGETLPSGHFIKFYGDPKVYTVVSHNGYSLTIFPALRSGKITGQAISYGDKVTLEATYDLGTVSGMTYTDGILSDVGTLKFIEDL